jgi:hypothetical protein
MQWMRREDATLNEAEARAWTLGYMAGMPAWRNHPGFWRNRGSEALRCSSDRGSHQHSHSPVPLRHGSTEVKPHSPLLPRSTQRASGKTA